jgi:uncharacterized protein (TIGR03083 family)
VTTPRELIWNAVHAERAALADDLEPLTAGQWRTETACPGWSVHDVLAHLLDTARTTRTRFLRDMLVCRFDFDRQNARGLARERREDPRDTLAAFRTELSSTSTPPAAIATRLVEAYVHGEDIRRAVGLVGDYPTDLVLTALQYQLRTGTALGGGKQRAQGLRLIAEDASFDSGSGAEVSGSALALLLAVSGRPVRPGELSGPGASPLSPAGDT